MKRSLYVKVWILLGYVAVCTALVLLEQQGEHGAPASSGKGDAIDRRARAR